MTYLHVVFERVFVDFLSRITDGICRELLKSGDVSFGAIKRRLCTVLPLARFSTCLQFRSTVALQETERCVADFVQPWQQKTILCPTLSRDVHTALEKSYSLLFA